MGTHSSKKENKQPPKTQQKTMPYKRQFSSEAARKTQNKKYTEHRQNQDVDDQKLSALSEATTQTKTKPDILDPEKYKPPPAPAPNANANDSANPTLPTQPTAPTPTKDDEDDDDEPSASMTDAQALQIKKNTERALSPGANLCITDVDEKQSASNKSLGAMAMPQSEQLIKQTSNHDRIASVSSINLDGDAILHPANGNSHSDITSCIQWGYCELTRKQLDEDQAAFLTWSHPTDGFVHSWAIFDGHGGYETALYSAQHFLKYVQKYHVTRTNMQLSKWKGLLREIFTKFDQHIGHLNIRGGSTVVVVLLVGKHIICGNAGDARAIMSRNNGSNVELSLDHTPMDDYERLLGIARQKDNYKKISKFFRLNSRNETYLDVQKLSGSEMKKAPFISREQDKSRLLGTIGVARGFGDFGLTVFGFRSIKLKAYLSAEPYVVIKELREEEVLETDILCIACDGVFDVMTNQEVIKTLRNEIFYRKKGTEMAGDDGDGDDDDDDKESVYAKEANVEVETSCIDRACGFLGLRAYAKGTMDDVTIFTIPLKQIFEFYKNNNNK